MKYIDLFAGCGGLSLGLEKAGFELVVAVEKSPMAAETFYHNFIKRLDSAAEWNAYCNSPIEEQFKHKLIVNEVGELLKNNAIMERLRGEDIDLIAGGPPCQGFSMAGRRDPNDIRNLLPLQFLEVVRRVQPKAVLIENVVGIRHNFNKHGEKAPIEQINLMLKDIKPGYITQLIEVNAMHYGVPQHRPRIMLLGLRKDIAKPLEITSWNGFWKSSYDLLLDSKLPPRPTLAPKATFQTARTVKDALWDLVKDKYIASTTDKQYKASEGDYARMMRENTSSVLESFEKLNKPFNQALRNHAGHIADRFRLYQLFQKFGVSVKVFNTAASEAFSEQEKRELILSELEKISFPAQSPDGKILASSKQELFQQVLVLTTKKHSQRPLKWDAPSPTVLSLPDDFVHPCEPRTMTVREMARLQSFPDYFEFRSKETTGSLRRRFEVPQYTQVGNAVPPLLAEATGKNFFELLKTFAASKKPERLSKTPAKAPRLKAAV